MSFKSSRLVTCSFPSDIRRRSSRTMSSNSFSFCSYESFENVSFFWKSCYPQHIRICCMPFLHGAICLRCFTCIFIQTKNPSCMLSLNTSLYNKALSYNEALSISLTKSFKRSRPMSLWELNPLVLAYRAKSFPKTELQLRVLNKLVSLEEFHLPSLGDSWIYC